MDPRRWTTPTDHVVRTDMLLFRMIPVTLRAFTIAIGSVLVMTLAKHHARKRVAVAPARIDDDRHDLLDIPARSGHDHTPTVVR